jgi:hypothetical protein
LLDFIIFYYKQAHLFLVPLVPLVFWQSIKKVDHEA